MSFDFQQVEDALPNYDVGDELGRGGWGVVLAGRHRNLGREVAIKQLPVTFATDSTVRARFVVEARVLASLDHPHIVPIYDFVETGSLCLLVMEMLPGGTVWSRFTSEGFTPLAACAVVLATSAGLHEAHARGILHRDIKPENLMFSGSGAIKVTDFGIAKVISGDETMATLAGQVLGTPTYMAPEQVRGSELSPATDVYSTSTMLYELLTGDLPFTDDGDAMALMYKHAYETPTHLSDWSPEIPDAIAAVVMQGLATAPEDRYESAQSFAVALAEACTGAWGPGWLEHTSIPVTGSNTIVAATERLSQAPRAVPTVGSARTTEVGTLGAPATVAPGTPTGDVTPPAQIGVPTVKPSATPVRPSIAVHARGVDLADVDVDQLVAVKEVVKPPRRSGAPLLVAAALLVFSVVFALVGLGSPPRGGNLAHGALSVAGADPTSGAVIPLNLAKPIPVTLGPGAPAANEVKLSLSVLGASLNESVGAVAPSGSSRTATLNDSRARYLLAGRVTGQVELLNGAAVVARWQFPVRTAQTGIISLPGGIAVLVLLFSIAYVESSFRSLRRGRRKVSATLSLVVMGALLTIALEGVLWLTVGHEPTVATVVTVAALGALGGGAIAVAGARIGSRRRFKRAQHRAAKA
jgi:hypothetical protein